MHSRWFDVAAATALAITCSGCGDGDSGTQTTAAASTQSVQAPLGKLAPAPIKVRPPNILFILVDDLRPDLGVYGDTVAKTPNMDALAASGAVFDNSFVSMAYCAPSRASMLTGLRPDTTKVYNLSQKIDQTIPGAVSLGDLFRGAGYRTLRIGKVFHLSDDDANGWADVLAEPPASPMPGGLFGNSYGRAPDKAKLQDGENVKVAKKQLQTLSQSATPFLFAVGLHLPHLPFYVPGANWDRYSAAQIPGPINPTGQIGAFPWSLVSWEIWDYADLKPYNPTVPADKADMMRWGYLASVSYVDDMVGQLMDELKKDGLADNTIVVLWGDNGYKLGDHGYWAKHSNADLDVRVPLIFSAPGRIPAGERVKGLVEAVDIYPTLAQMAGIPVGPQLEGMSFAPLFAAPTREWKSAVFTQFFRDAAFTNGRGSLWGYKVRTTDFSYTNWLTWEGRSAGRELYDLRNDPNETVNVASQPEYASTVAALEQIRMGGWKGVQAKVAN